MWWKIYFWILLILSVVGLFGLLSGPRFAFADIVGFIFNIVVLVGLYAYIYKKNIWHPLIWKVAFWIWVVFSVEMFLELYILSEDFINKYLFVFKSNLSYSEFEVLLSWLLAAPAIYVLYILSKKKSRR
ncbi:MAG: hypothetical protein C4584_02800 [Armatimonadetes bacterium]|nr:MAG: hypothetical protein C4584_02800 [Armatimonadota bacterium]